MMMMMMMKMVIRIIKIITGKIDMDSTNAYLQYATKKVLPLSYTDSSTLD